MIDQTEGKKSVGTNDESVITNKQHNQPDCTRPRYCKSRVQTAAIIEEKGMNFKTVSLQFAVLPTSIALRVRCCT